MALDGWSVTPVSSTVAQQVIVEKHYLHRKALLEMLRYGIEEYPKAHN